MFHVKICGLKNVSNAIDVASAGADAIGLNFFTNSKRYVEPTIAAEIATAVRGKAEIVGLFVNAPLKQIQSLHDQIHFDWIQIHGDESFEFYQQLVQNIDAKILIACRGTLRRWPEQQCPVGSYLVDANVPGSFGGTGQKADWNLAADWASLRFAQYLVLAGGLTPENVSQAIRQVHPTAVDVAGGVEQKGQSGIKDIELVRQFVESARQSFKEIGTT